MLSLAFLPVNKKNPASEQDLNLSNESVFIFYKKELNPVPAAPFSLIHLRANYLF